METKERENVSVRMSPRLHKQLRVTAINQSITMSDIIEKACNDYLTNQENDDKQAA